VGSGTDRTWGSGAGQPGGHPDRPGVARAGPTWPLSLCCPACPGWFPPGPGQMRPGPARGRGDGGWQGTSGPGEASVTQPTAAFLWSLSPGAWCGRKGALQGGQRDLLPMPPSWPSPSGSADCGDGGSQPVTQGFFPSKGTRAQVAVARPWGQGDHGPLLHQLAGGQDSAGLCPWHRRGCGGKIQVVSLCCGLPGVGDAGPPSEHSPEPEGAQPGVASSPGKGQEGCRGCRSPLPAPPPLRGKTLGGEAPGGSGLRAAGQWLGWWQQEPRQAGPPLGAGPGWGHRKSQ